MKIFLKNKGDTKTLSHEQILKIPASEELHYNKCHIKLFMFK